MVGWFFDGCYHADMYSSPDPPNMVSFAAAARAGNPNAILMFNNGAGPSQSLCSLEDLTAGEIWQQARVRGLTSQSSFFAVGVAAKTVRKSSQLPCNPCTSLALAHTWPVRCPPAQFTRLNELLDGFSSAYFRDPSRLQTGSHSLNAYEHPSTS